MYQECCENKISILKIKKQRLYEFGNQKSEDFHLTECEAVIREFVLIQLVLKWTSCIRTNETLFKQKSLFICWHTSPTLFKYLHQNQTSACGIVHKNERGLLTFNSKLQRNESESFHFFESKHFSITYLHWNSKKVYMLSITHSEAYINLKKINYRTDEHICKPLCTVNYRNKSR